MITQRAVIVATIGFCLYFIAFVNALPSYFYVLTWLSVSILVCSAGLAMLSVEGLQCRWHVAQRTSSESLDEWAEFAESESPPETGPIIEIEIENRGTLNKTGTVVDVRLLHVGRNEETTRRFLIEALPANTGLTSGLTLSGLPRGRYQIQYLTVIGTDVLGFFRARRRVELRSENSDEKRPGLLARFNRKRRKKAETISPDAEVLIGPASVDAGVRSGEGASVAAGSEASSTDLVGRSDEVRGTRPYVAGDDLRTVHWKSTARLGRLVVREFDRLARPECVVIWDGTSAWGNELILYTLFDSTSPVEFGLSLSASLVRAMADARRPCALLRLDSQPLWVPSQSRRSGANSGYLAALEALTTADAVRASSLTAALGPFTKELSESSEVFLVSASPTPDLREAVAALRRIGLRVELAQFNAAEWPATNDIAYDPNARGLRGQKMALNLSKLIRRAAKSVPVAPGANLLTGVGARVVPVSPVLTRHAEVEPALRRAVLALVERRSQRRDERKSAVVAEAVTANV